MKGPRLVVLAWLVAVGIIAWSQIHAGTRPKASGFAGAALVYSVLAGMAASASLAPLAGALAVGWTGKLAYEYVIGADAKPSAPTPLKRHRPKPARQQQRQEEAA